jgi:hypothetical protein
MAKPTSFRLSDATRAKIAYLADTLFGRNQTTALTVAIDRMYREERSTMITANPMSAKAAIHLLATTHSSQVPIDVEDPDAYGDLRQEAVLTLTAAVEAASRTGDRTQSLQDWIYNGSYDGTETVDSIAAEWDALSEETAESDEQE